MKIKIEGCLSVDVESVEVGDKDHILEIAV